VRVEQESQAAAHSSNQEFLFGRCSFSSPLLRPHMRKQDHVSNRLESVRIIAACPRQFPPPLWAASRNSARARNPHPSGGLPHPEIARFDLRLKACPLIERIIEFRVRVRQLIPAMKSSNLSTSDGSPSFFLARGDSSTGCS